MSTKDPMMAVDLEIAGDWAVRARTIGGTSVCFEIAPAPVFPVIDEPCGPLPAFEPTVGGWLKGYRLAGVATQETTAMGMLCPESLQLQTTGPDARKLVQGQDFEFDPVWGTVGRLEGGGLGMTEVVLASYSYRRARIDSIVERPGGTLDLRQGKPHVVQPAPPELASDERRLANLFLSGRQTNLNRADMFPVQETCYPEQPRPAHAAAARLTPKSYEKLEQGRRLRILAWGDSVTDGGFLPNPSVERWQEQFRARLRERFPAADIELLTEAWPGRNTTAYLDEPPGAEHNFQETVLALKPDLVISEFVNDSGYRKQQVNDVYGRIAIDFEAIGAEWILLTPHYILPDWMGTDRQKDIDDDPRAYVTGLREFAATNDFALADASRRWGRLWRQGIPYMTYMTNGINHPDARGMRIFADSLMDLF